MNNDLIHDRGRGPEIRGTRITIQDLILYFLDPTYTEELIAKLHDLTKEQVAAARSYIMSDPETTLIEYKECESRPEQTNPPEVTEQLMRTRESLRGFRDWLANRRAQEASEESSSNGTSDRMPSFREWLAEQEANATGPVG